MNFIFNHDGTEAINCTAVRKFSIILDDYQMQENGKVTSVAWVVAELDNSPVNELGEVIGVKLKEFKVGDASENFSAAQAWLTELIDKLNGGAK
ncbi:MAG: hypothetical protein IJ685_14310 [Selenomonadaceae bacterium]|nr:hypothetical protein [Selenomonadaceae bacterium]